ncbi:MAG TPA: tautomerase family protein [Methanocella sp.]|nr:tautomerase family protein [Methanocella sp.]
MPFAQIWIYSGKSDEYRHAVLDGVESAIIEALSISGPNVFQALTEMEPGKFRRAGQPSENFTLIEINLFAGRPLEIKKRLYKAIAENLQKSPGIRGSDLVILLQESGRENWSVRDGLPASETGRPSEAETSPRGC